MLKLIMILINDDAYGNCNSDNDHNDKADGNMMNIRPICCD